MDVENPAQSLYTMQPRSLLHDGNQLHQRQRLDLLSLPVWILPGRPLPVCALHADRLLHLVRHVRECQHFPVYEVSS